MGVALRLQPSTWSGVALSEQKQLAQRQAAGTFGRRPAAPMSELPHSFLQGNAFSWRRGCSGLLSGSLGNFERFIWNRELHLAARQKFRRVCPPRALLLPFQKQAQQKVAVPMDFYKVLGATPGASRDMLLWSFNARLRETPGDGAPFSSAAVASRNRVLSLAEATLADPAERAVHDRALEETGRVGAVMEFLMEEVAGVLLALQDAGAWNTVASIGTTLLQEGPLPRHLRQDIALAVALAYVDLARDKIGVQGGAFATDRLLRLGRDVLQSEGGRNLASDLYDNISNARHELAPWCVLELLRLPLDASHAEERRDGIQGLRQLLWDQGRRGGASKEEEIVKGLTRERFLSEALASMTAAEQVALFAQTPHHIPAVSSEVYTAALAYVAEGFVTHTPRLIQEADSLFQQLQGMPLPEAEPLPPSPDTGAPRVYTLNLERAMSSMLLGQVEHAKALLGLTGVPTDGDPSLVSFVYSRSGGRPGDVDPLPGLVALTESWLQDAVLSRFRDTASMTAAPLREYFDDDTVQAYLEGLERASPLLVAEQVVRTTQRATAALSSLPVQAVRSLSALFAAHFPSPPAFAPSTPATTALDFPPSLDAQDSSPASEAWSPEAPAFGAGPVDRDVRRGEVSEQDTWQPAIGWPRRAQGSNGAGDGAGQGVDSLREAGLDDVLTLRAGGATEGWGEPGLLPGEWTAAEGPLDGREPEVLGADGGRKGKGVQQQRPGLLVPTVVAVAVMAVGLAVMRLRGAAQQEAQAQAPPVVAAVGKAAVVGKPVAVGKPATVGKPAAVGKSAVVGRQPIGSKVAAGAAVTVGKPVGKAGGGRLGVEPEKRVKEGGGEAKGGVGEGKGGLVGEMDSVLAEMVIRRWQEAKARALGAKGDVEGFKEVLGEGMLSYWTTLANSAHQDGFYWAYRLLSVNVESVAVSEGGKRADVRATLKVDAKQYNIKSSSQVIDSFSKTVPALYVLRSTKQGWRVTSLQES